MARKEKAEAFFLDGMTQAMHRPRGTGAPGGPITIYYAFKQSDTSDDAGTLQQAGKHFLKPSLGLASQLAALGQCGRSEHAQCAASESNALASSIVLVCRKRPADAPTISRREFMRELNAVLPEALDEMTKGAGDDRSPVAPVDLSQAIIGPGMAVFSKYAAVLEADGSPMSVRTALQLINRFLAEDDFDADTQFCLHWFEQHGWEKALWRCRHAGPRQGHQRGRREGSRRHRSRGGGKVRLLKWAEYPADWDPRTDTRTPVWEALHQLIRALKQDGESGVRRAPRRRRRQSRSRAPARLPPLHPLRTPRPGRGRPRL